MWFLRQNRKDKIRDYLTINDLKKINIDFGNAIDRKKYKILILDDDGFNIDGLIKLGYKDITVEYRYSNIEQFIPYQIILCDINGIASDLDPKYQGAALSKKIKETYPDKIVIIFSALELPLDFEKYYRCVDAVIPKNTNNSELSTLLDEYINKLSSPIDRWCVIKKTLEDSQISTRDISVFEHFYVKSFIEKKDFTKEIEKYFLSDSTNTQKAMDKIFKFTLEIAKDLITSYVSK